MQDESRYGNENSLGVADHRHYENPDNAYCQEYQDKYQDEDSYQDDEYNDFYPMTYLNDDPYYNYSTYQHSASEGFRDYLEEDYKENRDEYIEPQHFDLSEKSNQ